MDLSAVTQLDIQADVILALSPTMLPTAAMVPSPSIENRQQLIPGSFG
jgi:hypothetical protein